MELILQGHDARYAVEQLQTSLFPDAPEGTAVSSLHRGKKWLTAVTVITIEGKTSRGIRRLAAEGETVRLLRRILQQSYYAAALPLLAQAPPWGALAGVRPTKLTTAHLLRGGTEESAKALLENVYYVSPSRQALALDCSRSAVRAAKMAKETDLSLYIGIPFCPTRCAYCSFVSRSIGRQTDLMTPYLEALYREMVCTGDLLKKSGRQIRTVYIGGGTPTTLTAGQLDTLMKQLREQFDLSRCVEITVEGGRPDTLTAEKFRVLRENGVHRLSINPQTMEDNVLRACGRPHRGEDVVLRYREALDAGFGDVNMDLIAGLPEDTCDGFRRSLDQVISLAPTNITVHTLALKKGADLFEHREKLPTGDTVARMVAYAEEALRSSGYRPYYLYRQKYMSGSFENVGWSRDGRDCLYNIYMMEELHTVLSLGGGGMNKVNLPDGTLRRFHNPKYPEQYIGQIGDVLRQKEELFSLL